MITGESPSDRSDVQDHIIFDSSEFPRSNGTWTSPLPGNLLVEEGSNVPTGSHASDTVVTLIARFLHGASSSSSHDHMDKSVHDEQSPPPRKRDREIEHQPNRIINRNSTNGTRPSKARHTSAPRAAPRHPKRSLKKAGEHRVPKRIRIQMANQDAIDAYERTSTSRRLADKPHERVTQHLEQQPDIEDIIAMF